MEGSLAMYPIHMSMDERREELCQREQKYGKDVERLSHNGFYSSIADLPSRLFGYSYIGVFERKRF